MKTKLHGLLFGIFIGVVLAACGGSGADDPPPTGGNNDDLTELTARVEKLESDLADALAAIETLSESVNVVVAKSSGTTGSAKGAATRVQKLADAEAIGCGFSGYLPQDQKTATEIQCKTPAGYLFDLPWPQGGAPTFVGVYYELPGCMGTPYVPEFEVEDGAREQGIIASYFDGAGKHIGYIPAGSALVSRTVVSLHNGDGCIDVGTDSRSDLVVMLQHDVDTGEDVADSVDSIPGANDVTGGKNDYPAMTVQ
jgi:hypothetical protein